MARSGKFSSDRTIREYAKDIWSVKALSAGVFMNWEQRYRLRHSARTSLVMWAGLSMVLAIFSAMTVRWIDQQTDWKMFNYSPDGARAVLSILIGSMLTFIVFVLSATLIVVQLASGQFTPRVIAIIFSQPGIKVTLGMLTFTFAYSLAALARVEDRVPDLHVGIAVLLNLVCILAFFFFAQQLSSGLRPSILMRYVADRSRKVIDQVYPMPHDPMKPEQAGSGIPDLNFSEVVDFKGRSGVMMAFSITNLVRQARLSDAVFLLVPQVGDFVAVGDPLFRIATNVKAYDAEELQASVAVGNERTLEQDPRFGFRILVDMASKALSPAINDPTTAVIALDQIDDLLLLIGQRHLDDGHVHDREGNLRLVFGTPDWPDFVMLAVSEIRQFGESSLQVNRRLRAMLGHLIEALPPARQPALQVELDMLESGAGRRFLDAEDLHRAKIADYQGIGGSES